MNEEYVIAEVEDKKEKGFLHPFKSISKGSIMGIMVVLLIFIFIFYYYDFNPWLLVIILVIGVAGLYLSGLSGEQELTLWDLRELQRWLREKIERERDTTYKTIFPDGLLEIGYGNLIPNPDNLKEYLHFKIGVTVHLQPKNKYFCIKVTPYVETTTIIQVAELKTEYKGGDVEYRTKYVPVTEFDRIKMMDKLSR